MGEVECFVCKAERKKEFTFDVEDNLVGSAINCPFCQLQFILRRRGNKLRLEYPDIPENEGASATNFDNIKEIQGGSGV